MKSSAADGPASSQQSRPSSGMPKGYDKVVERMRKKRQEEEEIKEKDRKAGIGERYDREKLNRLTSPTFLRAAAKKEVPRWKKEALVTLEIKIGPQKNAKISLKEGDNPRLLARNFAKTYQLDTELEE